MQELIEKISLTGKETGAQKIVLFGSRARGDNRKNSDVDIAVYGLDKRRQSEFRERIDDLDTLLEFDIVFISRSTDAVLLENVKKEGKVIMENTTKLQNLKKATQRLKEALEDYADDPKDSIRDGVVQRFEFCTELAWKATREYLLAEGYTDINSPKSTMKKAYACELIKDQADWLQLLQDRNLTSHIYEEEEVDEIFIRIKDRYVFMLETLADRLSDNN